MTHRDMHSAAKGKGNDAYIREEKRKVSRSSPQAVKAFRRKRDEKKKKNEYARKTMQNVFEAWNLYGYGPGDKEKVQWNRR